jgi:hypothetical protein
MVNFVKSAPELFFKNLLSIINYEHWEKLGDGLDEQREQDLGPILAEKGFTVVDLLKTIGLDSEALYYKNRGIHKIYKKNIDSMPVAPFDNYSAETLERGRQKLGAKGIESAKPLSDRKAGFLSLPSTASESNE